MVFNTSKAFFISGSMTKGALYFHPQKNKTAYKQPQTVLDNWLLVNEIVQSFSFACALRA